MARSWSRTSDPPAYHEQVALPLSYPPASEQSGLEPQPPACETGALPVELSAVRMRLREGGLRDKGVEPRSPRSERGVLPVGRSRSRGTRSRIVPLSVHLPASSGRSTQSVCCELCHGRLQSQPLFFKPLANPSTLDRRSAAALLRVRRPTWRGFGARRSQSPRKPQAKAADIHPRPFSCAQRRGPFSLRRGLMFDQSLFKLSITSSLGWVRFRNDEGGPSGRPRCQAAMRPVS